ncbi:MAG: TlpA family protein disulfide reductase [Candidatus Omnitrophica bacterium]|nr:TlpA family protein disulfide reductase [Candidatus Omnitrophota bacterium]
MKKYLCGTVILVSMMLCFIGCVQAEKDESGKEAAQEKQMLEAQTATKPLEKPRSAKFAPDFSLQDTRQDNVTLSEYKNKNPVLLFFWTTWCPFCQKEIRNLNSQYGSLVKDGFEVIAINVGERADVVESFISSFYLSFRVLLDKDTAVATQYGILGVPTYVLVDKEGKIIFKDNYFPQEEYKALIGK